MLPPAADAPAPGWGSPALRRATLTLAVTQLVSWGVLFYAYAVVAPEIGEDTGWSPPLVSGALSFGLLVAGVAAPFVARALAAHDPRLVLTAGSLAGMAGIVLVAAAHSLPALYAAWAVVGLAMAATLYEPAMAVLVVLDPARRVRTLTVVTVFGGLASTVFAPLTGALASDIGWRAALVVLGVASGVTTAVLHAAVLPAPGAHPERVTPLLGVAGAMGGRVARLRTALLFEQAAVIATTVHLVGLLADRGAAVAFGAVVLGTMGVGKVAGRLLLLGPPGRAPLATVAAGCNLAQLAGLALPLATTGAAALLPAAFVVGAASGATTVLRPLLVTELVGPARFAAVNARLHRTTTIARAGAPFLLGAVVAVLGWAGAWVVCLAAFAVAAERFASLGRRPLVSRLRRAGGTVSPAWGDP